MQQLDFKNERTVFSTWSVLRVYKRDDICSSVQLREGNQAAKAWALEAEESPLLETVSRERLVKTLQVGEDLVFSAVIYKMWRMAMVL
jgi:hypothetical protein